MLIIGPKALHPISSFKYEFPEGKRPEDYFRNEELPKIKTILDKNKKVHVYVVAQHFAHRNLQTYAAYEIIQRYNKVVREIVISQNNPRLKYVGVVEKIGLIEEENIILTVDGTHWNWKKDKRTKQQGQVPISPASLGLLDVIFNHFCFYK